jgi:hypothetical protein
MSGEAGEVRKRTFLLVKNSLSLSFILIFLSILRPELISLINFAVQGLEISGDLVLNIIILLIIVYFGYSILLNVKYFLDLASARFARKSLVTPILTPIQGIGSTAAKIVNIILLAVGFFIVYHLANQVYSLVKQEVEKLVPKLQREKDEGKST